MYSCSTTWNQNITRGRATSSVAPYWAEPKGTSLSRMKSSSPRNPSGHLELFLHQKRRHPTICVGHRKVMAVTVRDLHPQTAIKRTHRCAGSRDYLFRLGLHPWVLASWYCQTRRRVNRFSSHHHPIYSPFIVHDVTVFLDDFGIFLKRWESHIKHFRDVFSLFCYTSPTVEVNEGKRFPNTSRSLGHVIQPAQLTVSHHAFNANYDLKSLGHNYYGATILAGLVHLLWTFCAQLCTTWGVTEQNIAERSTKNGLLPHGHNKKSWKSRQCCSFNDKNHPQVGYRLL